MYVVFTKYAVDLNSSSRYFIGVFEYCAFVERYDLKYINFINMIKVYSYEIIFKSIYSEHQFKLMHLPHIYKL